jgi:transcriptional regulator with XRE-family HTH domain
VRTIRIRQRLTQATLAALAGTGRKSVSMLECGRAGELRLATVSDILSALGARMDLRVLWNGPELDRMLDAAHSALGASVKRRLERWGWIVRIEVSFNRYGERGRVDLLAWHPRFRVLLVVELKTDFVDAQSLLGTLDMKARLGRHIARQFGWDVRAVIPAIVFTENATVRRRLEAHDTLFDRYERRGRASISWLRRPTDVPTGLLWFVTVPMGAGSSARRRWRAPRAA